MRDITEIIKVAPAKPNIRIRIVLIFLPSFFLLVWSLFWLDAFAPLLLYEKWRIVILLVAAITILVDFLVELVEFRVLFGDETVFLRALLGLLRCVYVGGEGVSLVVEIHLLKVVQKPIIIQIVFLILFRHPTIKDGRILNIHLPHKLFSKIALKVQAQIWMLAGPFDFFKFLLLFFVVILLGREELRLNVLILIEAAVEEFRLLIYHLIFVLGERLERERLGLLQWVNCFVFFMFFGRLLLRSCHVVIVKVREHLSLLDKFLNLFLLNVN